MTQPEISSISPFFIVRDVAAALSFYRDRLGFEITFQGFGDDLFFGIVRRGGAMIMFKSVGVDPLPNYGLRVRPSSTIGSRGLRRGQEIARGRSRAYLSGPRG